MSTLFPVGHVLKGRIGQYVISKQLQETVWLAKLVLPSRAPSALARGLDTYLMHSEGFVHSDIKPDNVMVNYGSNDTDNRFTDVQLADFGGSLPEDHQHAREGTPIGAAIWRSPESLFGMPWDVKTDIWSFGTLVNKFCLIAPAIINANQISRLDSSSASSTGPTSTFSIHQA